MKTALKYLKNPIVHMAVIALLAIAAYSNTFHIPFQFDDIGTIVQNAKVKDLANVPGFFIGEDSSFASRPLLHATDAVNYYLDGMNTRGYHAVNLAVHIINAILLYLLILMTGRHMRLEEDDVRLLAALSAMIFAAHPLQTEAVTYITSRSMLLATMFYLLGPIVFLRAATAARGRGRYVAALFAVSMLGMASRENFATFPLMLFFYDLLFVSALNPREALRRHYALYLAAALPLGYLAFIILGNTYDRSIDYPGIGIRPLHYIITQFKVHWTYLRLLVLPIGQNADYDYPISRSLFNPAALIAFVGYAGLWAGAVLKARKRPLFSFGVLWFLVTLIPISFGVSLMSLRLGNVIFEHRVYLPSAGAIVAGVWAVLLLTKGRERARKAAVSALVVMSLVFAVAAHARNTVWFTDKTLWEDVVKKSPNKERGHYNLGLALRHEGETQAAIKNFEAAVKYREGKSNVHDFGIVVKDRSHFNLGMLYQERGNIEKAIEEYEMVIKITQKNALAYNNLGMLYRQKGRTDKAIGYYKEALKLEPDNAEFHVNLGNAYDIEDKMDEAIDQYKEAARLDPKNALTHYNLAITYQRKGMEEESQKELEKAVEVKPDFVEAQFALAQIHLRRGEKEEARKYLKNVLRINPNHYWANQFLQTLDEGKTP